MSAFNSFFLSNRGMGQGGREGERRVVVVAGRREQEGAVGREGGEESL